MSADNRKSLTRRQAIQGAASLVGGTIAAAQLGGFMSRAALAATEGSDPVFFDDAALSLIERIADLMIPETDTPGALAAGVPHFIDLMLAEWASSERQQRFNSGLGDLEARLDDAAGGDFSGAPSDRQLESLRTVDEQAFSEDNDSAFYRELKRLMLFAYYSSEAGATVELQYEPLIPDYKACVPVDDIGRAWFWLGFSHGL
jgi:gluconate 2-dehydrogenase gamma chain